MKVTAFTSGSALLATCAPVAAALASLPMLNKGLLLGPPRSIADEESGSSKLHKRETNSSVTWGNATFQQLLDHADPSKGTFNQTYWWNSEYWQGPGSPVVLFNGGEFAGTGFTGYAKNKTITGELARRIGAAALVIEHRYYGTSSPFSTLTVENLTYLTLENVIHDMPYFANNVKLPFATHASSNADSVPWVMTGGSYGGALTAWVESVAPGTFWAYYSSSGTLESIENFWQYYEPIREAMPVNCSADVNKVIDHVDSILSGDDGEAKLAIKAKFGLADLEHDDDFASSLSLGPNSWHNNYVGSGYTEFFKFCDSVENVGPLYPDATVVPGAEGVGLEKALEGYSHWLKTEILPTVCEDDVDDEHPPPGSVKCLNTYNESSVAYTRLTVPDNLGRQYMWLVCSRYLPAYTSAPPPGRPTLVSRTGQTGGLQRQCDLYFRPPGSSGPAVGKTDSKANEYTGGWDHAGSAIRVIHVNGEHDPLRSGTVASDFRPGGPFKGTKDAVALVTPGGYHCSEMLYGDGENPVVKDAQDAVFKQISEWVREFHTDKGKAERAAMAKPRA